MASVGDSQPRLKQHPVHALRSLGLPGSAEWLNRRWAIAKSNTDDDRFCREHSDFVPPPLAAMHDAYGTIAFQSYREGGQYFARVMAELISCIQPTRLSSSLFPALTIAAHERGYPSAPGTEQEV